MRTKTAIAMLMCVSSVYAYIDSQDVQVRYDKNSYLKNLAITPEIEADMKAHKETLLYVVKRNECNYQKIFADSLVAVTAKIEAIESDMQNIERLKDLQGQKYSSDDDREFVGRQIELYEAPAQRTSALNSYNQTRYTNSISAISGVFKAAKEDIAFSNLQKNALKELKKNKIGEKTISVLAYRMAAFENEKNTYNQRKETLANWQQYEPTRIVNMLWFDPDKIDEYFVCNDTIVNPFNPAVVREKNMKRFKENPSEAARAANASVDEGWEWIFKDSKEYMHEDFPRSISFYQYASHPDLRIVEDYSTKGIYDKNGNLMAIVNPNLGLTADADINSRDDSGILVARFAYENNDHDIQSYDAKTRHYVKTRLGLEEQTAKEKAESKAAADRIANAMGNYYLDNMKYGSRTKKGRQAQYNNAGNIVGALLSAQSSSYSSTGSNWFDQIKRDYSEVYVFERERIDDLTFRSVYADKDANPLFEIITKYVGNGSYKFKKTTVELKKCPKTDKAEQSAEQKIAEFEAVVTQPTEQKQVNNTVDTIVYGVAEQMPSFPDGDAAMAQWIDSNLNYPATAKENGIQGRVVCSFIVETDGTITDVQVTRSVEPSLDKEAIRLLNAMPTWNPGRQAGSPVRVKYTLPIIFRLK